MLHSELANPVYFSDDLVEFPGPAVCWSERGGSYNRFFKMPKFRAMRIETPAVATHLLENPTQWPTLVGSFFA